MASATVGSGRERVFVRHHRRTQRYVMLETYENPEDNKDELRCCSVAKII
jgi:hypothetical protein